MTAMAGTDVDTATTSVHGPVARMIRDLPPAAFAFVMATGIISTDTYVQGPVWLSRVLLTVDTIGLIVLVLMLAIRLAWFWPRVLADLGSPERTFGFFTVVAGIDVLGARIAGAGHPLVTAILAMAATLVWLCLTYAIPANLLLGRSRDSVIGGINGTWLLWVVATQSLAICAVLLVPTWPGQARLLGAAAVGLWGVGLVLYIVLVTLIMLRWLTVPMTPAALGPPYWILMGATAITVRAGAQILELPAGLAVFHVSAGLVSGFSYVLWSFGTWWIPLLVILGLWRHLKQHWPMTYETALWSVVFPLGMYSAATGAFGKITHLSFMTPISRVMMWVAVAAWTIVAVGGLISLTRRPAEPGT